MHKNQLSIESFREGKATEESILYYVFLDSSLSLRMTCLTVKNNFDKALAIKKYIHILLSWFIMT